MTTKKMEGICAYMKKHTEMTAGIAAPLFSYREKRKQLSKSAKQIREDSFDELLKTEDPGMMEIRTRLHRVLNTVYNQKESDVLLMPLAYKYGSYIEQCIEEHICEKEQEKIDDLVALFPRATPHISVGYDIIDESIGETREYVENTLVSDNIAAIQEDAEDYNKILDKEIEHWDEKQKCDEHIRKCLLDEPYGFRLEPRCIASVDVAGRGRLMYGVMDMVDEMFRDTIWATPELTQTFLDRWIQEHPKGYKKIRLEKAAQNPDQQSLKKWR